MNVRYWINFLSHTEPQMSLRRGNFPSSRWGWNFFYVAWNVILNQRWNDDKKKFSSQRKSAKSENLCKISAVSLIDLKIWTIGYISNLAIVGGNLISKNVVVGSKNSRHVVLQKSMNSLRVTIWCGLWSGGIIGSYFFENEEEATITVDLLYQTFDSRLISRNGVVKWSPRSWKVYRETKPRRMQLRS